MRYLSNEAVSKLPHPDTLSYLFEGILPEGLSNLRYELVQILLRKKVFMPWRLFDKWYLVTVDGTGYLSFRQKHCEKCLSRKLPDGSMYYYHPVLEAKIVTANGLAISIGTEFIENIPGKDKQDCEVIAYYRLAKKLKKKFPQLHMCFLMDGLYARRPVFKLCDKYGWKYIITFKEGSMSDVYNWYTTIRDKFSKDNCKEIVFNKRIQDYKWVSPLEHYETGEIFNMFECREIKKNNVKKRFAWITNFEITKNNVDKLANQGGRLRWKTENEGFNSQKNGGYKMEHAYSQHPIGMKNFYLLMQIAHMIDQLLEKGSLLKPLLKNIGAIKNIAFLLLESLRNQTIDQTFLDKRIQIRLNPG